MNKKTKKRGDGELQKHLFVIYRGVYYIALSEINQGERLVYHPQLVAVYHYCGALYIISAKAIQPMVDDIRLWR